MIEIKNFEKYPFLRESKTKSFQKLEIYKYSPTARLFFLVTPTFLKTPKVLCLDEAKSLVMQGKFVQYKKSSNIYEKINIAWENWSEDWEHDGVFYSANYGTNIDDAPLHDICGYKCRIGYYHGQLVWVHTRYDDTVRYCRFENVDKVPNWINGGWTRKRNVLPVFDNSKGEYI